MEAPRTINLDGISYDVTQFSQAVQSGAAIYSKFAAQLADQQLEVMKTQSAMQVLSGQIGDAMKKELDEKKAAAAASQEAAEPAAE